MSQITHRIPAHKRLLSACAIMLCLPLQTVSILTPLEASAIGTVIIEEVAWAGSSASIADEWIELANLGNVDVAIGGWTLTGAGASGQDITLPEDAIIPSHGTYLVANYAETNEKSALATAVQFATTAISLSNSSLAIELVDANQMLIDRSGNGNVPPAGATDPYASMMRSDALIPGDQNNTWTSATTSVGFKEGMLDLGTPGICDRCNNTLASDEPAEQQSEEEDEDADEPSTSTEDATDESTDETSDPTEPVENGTTSSTVEIIVDQPEATTSSTTALSESTETTEDEDADTPSPVFLNEIISNPTSGSEWIELRFPEGTTSTNRELLLYDGQGKIAIITAGTVMTASPYLVVQLASAKLNNGGDSASIRESDETTIDETQIPELDKGESWVVNPETDDWEITETLTPASENIIYRTPTTSSASSSSDSSSSSASSSSSVSSSSTSTQTTSTSSNATTVRAFANAVPAQQITYATVFLNEAVSNPASGPEWVELFFPEDASSTDRTFILHDSKANIKTIPSGTNLTLPHYLLVPLSGSKLNNSGEELSLLEADGTLIESTILPKLAKGTSWIKTADGTWSVSEILTPASENQPTLETTSSESSATIKETGNAIEDEQIDLIDDIFASAETANDTSSSVNRSSTSNTSDKITAYSLTDMFDETNNGVRARISGTVASVPKLFGTSHTFILQNEDGRGLIIYVPTHLHIPPFGSTVRVDGTLAVTDYGPQFKMKKTDIWMSLATSTPPEPRVVDLLAPSSEDAWSLVTIQGTVTSAGTASFVIETDEAISVTISAPTVTGFRTKRLVKGDTVQVTGLLNIKKLTPTVVIRTPSDVALVKHAEDTLTQPSSSSTQTKNKFPDWAPFASAGVAIAGTGGAKRFREIMRKRTLKRLMEKAKEKEENRN